MCPAVQTVEQLSKPLYHVVGSTEVSTEAHKENGEKQKDERKRRVLPRNVAYSSSIDQRRADKAAKRKPNEQE
jgi:hypothetical protein